MKLSLRSSILVSALATLPPEHAAAGGDERPLPAALAPYFTPPAEYATDLGDYPSPLRFGSLKEARTPADWRERRQEILRIWTTAMGAWPPLLETPELKVLRSETSENFTQH